jgi:HAD superfamily hydrolase (TIGR01509 family)
MAKAILFDVDGTLTDSNELHAAAWREAFLKFGADVPIEAVRSQIGKGGDNLMPALLPPELVDRCGSEIEEYRSTLYQRDYMPRVVPFPGVRALVERLKTDGKTVVLASSAKGAELKFNLDVAGVADLIDGTTSKDDVEHSKPCPDIFEAALAKAGVAANEAVVVGDSPFDIQAAAKLGITAVGVRSGGFPDEALRDAGAAALYDGPEDLLRNYETSPLA